MIVDMLNEASTVAWIGAGGVVIGAAVGALSGWASAAIGSSRARRDARNDRRRAAYAAFLGALDEILGIYSLSSSWQEFATRLDIDPEFRESFSQALGPVNRTCVDVILVGSPRAYKAVEGIEGARWRAVNGLKDLQGHDLPNAMRVFTSVRANFTTLARKELAGQPDLRREVSILGALAIILIGLAIWLGFRAFPDMSTKASPSPAIFLSFIGALAMSITGIILGAVAISHYR